ncbi:hypothetical protein MIND_00681600 [Mycena indigotica]|uniref:NodB homology domain-containing protein n=1 Tax=Mycena indigotica TaxID=2126181 RepID=A0A8H6W349_9AGAR|nr:uncharacterized protein MIND_00681600 [Mycena indigotica]KAF7301171.1 hypothetical protein MIND_00681600 [Mycena indigotica]
MSPSASLVISLLSASAVFAHSSLKYRATPQVYDACIKANDVALTFDDGPYIYLRSISDHFTAAGAKATFFMNGNNWDCIYNPDRISDVKYAYAAGHMIGSHTWSHADLPTLSTAQIQDGMFRMEEAFSRILGIKPAFMRPPFGDYNSNIQSIAAARGQSLALWDWDTGDADGNTTAQSEALYQDVINAKVTNALILEHETEETTSTTLVPFAINLFQSHGYNLVTMAECLGVDPYQAIGVPQTQSSSWTCDGTPDPGAACGGSIACETGTPVFSSTTTSGSTGPTPTPTPNQYFHPSASASKCLTAASNADGAAVEIEDCVSGGSTSQSWTISGNLLQIFGTRCLTVPPGSSADGTKLQISTCTNGNTNQQWIISGNTLQWSGHSSCLDLTNGVATNDNPASLKFSMQIWTCTGGPNQAWTHTTGPGTSGGGGQTIRPGASSNTCLSAPSAANGGPVVVQPCSSGSASQQWSHVGNTLVVYNSFCMDITGGSTTAGTKIQIWSCTPGQTGDANQQFTVTSSKMIQWVGQNDCIDLTNGNLTAGNQVQSWTCTANNSNQIWNFV